MSQPVFLAVETGGTKIVWRIADASGVALDEGRFPTGRPEDAAEQLVAAVADREVAAQAAGRTRRRAHGRPSR